jgi:nucleotide-binding universal stress UspA family protein
MLERDEVIDAEEMKKNLTVQKTEALAYLDTVSRGIGTVPAPVKMCVEAGSVVQAIFAVADREKIDLVAMTSHGWGGSRRTFYGSVASGMINKTDKPLLLIRAQAASELD